MCARFCQVAPPDAIERLLDVEIPNGVVPRYNIAPTQEVVAIVASEGGRAARWMQWGYVPHWAPEFSGTGRIVNARSEEVASKPSFRESFRRRRCLLPATAFFEWEDVPNQPSFDLFEDEAPKKSRKVPYAFGMSDGDPFCLAGIFDRQRDHRGIERETFAILTTAPNSLVESIHDRMPVIIDPDDYALWLDATTQDLSALLLPFPSDRMIRYRVSEKINNARNEDPKLVEPLTV
jgi:putative SOS response-associated peptidase YedK